MVESYYLSDRDPSARGLPAAANLAVARQAARETHDDLEDVWREVGGRMPVLGVPGQAEAFKHGGFAYSFPTRTGNIVVPGATFKTSVYTRGTLKATGYGPTENAQAAKRAISALQAQPHNSGAWAALQAATSEYVVKVTDDDGQFEILGLERPDMPEDLEIAEQIRDEGNNAQAVVSVYFGYREDALDNARLISENLSTGLAAA